MKKIRLESFGKVVGGAYVLLKGFVITVARVFHRRNLPWTISFRLSGVEKAVAGILCLPARSATTGKSTCFPLNGRNTLMGLVVVNE
jgi:hypothetical protein